MGKRICFAKRVILTLMLCLSVAVSMPCTVSAKTQQVTSGNKKVDKKAKAIIKKTITSDMSDAQKVKAVHDYIAFNCAYDYDNLLRGTIPAVSYTAEGVLLKKKAVCQGYAEAFKLLMDMLGIPCKMVTGTADNGGGYAGHAWNIVKVGGKWYHIDVTWDDPVPDTKNYVRYAYFLIPDKKMDDDHKWNRSSYKKCTTDSSSKFIRMIGEVSETMDEAVEAFYDDYMLHQESRGTVIINKKLYNEKFHYDLFDGLAEQHGIRFYGWGYTEPMAYGNYYIIQYNDFSY